MLRPVEAEFLARLLDHANIIRIAESNFGAPDRGLTTLAQPDICSSSDSELIREVSSSTAGSADPLARMKGFKRPIIACQVAIITRPGCPPHLSALALAALPSSRVTERPAPAAMRAAIAAAMARWAAGALLLAESVTLVGARKAISETDIGKVVQEELNNIAPEVDLALRLQAITLNEVERRWATTSTAEVMLPVERLKCVDPDTELRSALKNMDRNGVNQLPVVRAQQVIGMLSR